MSVPLPPPSPAAYGSLSVWVYARNDTGTGWLVDLFAGWLVDWCVGRLLGLLVAR